MFYGKLWYKVIFHQHTTHRNVKLLHTKSLEIKDMFVKITIFESFFIFDGKLCEQRDEQWKNNRYVSSVHCKPTFSEVFTNFESFVPDIYKRGLIKVYFTEVSNSDPIMGIIVSKSFWIKHLFKRTLISRFLKGSWFTFYHI